MDVKTILTPSQCRILWDSGIRPKNPPYWWAMKMYAYDTSDHALFSEWELMSRKQMDELSLPLGMGLDRIPAFGIAEIIHYLRDEEINIIPGKTKKYKVSIYGRDDMGFEEDNIVDALFIMLYELIGLKDFKNND